MDYTQIFADCVVLTAHAHTRTPRARTHARTQVVVSNSGGNNDLAVAMAGLMCANTRITSLNLETVRNTRRTVWVTLLYSP